jgi:hypothetical protein
MYSQLPSIDGSHPSICNPRMYHSVVTKNPSNMGQSWGSDCDAGHYLVVAKVRERLPVNKQRSHTFHMERFNLMKLNE